MLKPLALAAALALSTPTLAIECPLSHAIYGQPTSAARAIFFQPDRDWAANQIAGFRLEIAGTSYDGTVHMPNGFSQPKGRLTKDCAPDDTDTDACTFWDGIVYALVDGRIAELPHFVEKCRKVLDIRKNCRKRAVFDERLFLFFLAKPRASWYSLFVAHGFS